MKEYVAAELTKFVGSEELKTAYFLRQEQSEFFQQMSVWKKDVDDCVQDVAKLKEQVSDNLANTMTKSDDTLARLVKLEENLNRSTADMQALVNAERDRGIAAGHHTEKAFKELQEKVRMLVESVEAQAKPVPEDAAPLPAPGLEGVSVPMSVSISTPGASPAKMGAEVVDEEEMLNEADYAAMKKPALIALCRERNLKVSGNKPDLIARLVRGADILEGAPWAMPAGSAGGFQGDGKGDGKGSELSKNIYERKMFDKRVGKISGEKSDKGEK